MPKTIPGVTLRDIIDDDVDRLMFIFSKDPDTDADVVTAIVGYDWVDENEVVFDDARRQALDLPDLPDGALKANILAIREDQVVPYLLNVDGYS
jgi:hypothetical protein